MERSRVGIVIPAYNESASIGKIVEAVKDYGTPIVVDDGSTDHTGRIAQNSGAIVIKHPVNHGYDAALNSGFKRAHELSCEIIITMDGDGQHDAQLLQKFIEKIESGSIVVVGVRGRYQRFAEHFFALYTKYRFGIVDPLCGMKAYRISVYEELGYFDSYQSIGTELIIFAAKRGCQIEQIPFEVRARSGKSRFGGIFYANAKIFRALLMSFKVSINIRKC